MSTAKTPEDQWAAIRAQLTGLRLAVYDDLAQVSHLRVGPEWTEEQRAALLWLYQHRLAAAVNFSDIFCAVAPEAARTAWLSEGPRNISPTPPEYREPAELATTAPSSPTRPAAYGQQAQFFDLEGYKK